MERVKVLFLYSRLEANFCLVRKFQTLIMFRDINRIILRCNWYFVHSLLKFVTENLFFYYLIMLLIHKNVRNIKQSSGISDDQLLFHFHVLLFLRTERWSIAIRKMLKRKACDFKVSVILKYLKYL